MKLLKVKIKNFMQHENLELSFHPDLNVITGLTEAGKTNMFHAINWLFGFSKISEQDFRKENTDITSVEGLLDNGFCVERLRSNTINRYIIKKDNCDDKIFDKFGSETPKEVQEVLEISEIVVDNIPLNLNFAFQDDINFILDKRVYPATFSAKLFNKLTGNEALDSAFKLLNKDSLSINRNIKDTEEQLEKQSNELADYSSKYQKLKTKYNAIQEKFKDILENVNIYEQMLSLANNIKLNKENQEFVSFKISKIKTLADSKIKELKEKSEQLKNLKKLFSELENININLEKIETQKNKVKTLNINFKDLYDKSNQLKTIEQLSDNIKKINLHQENTKNIIQQKQKILSDTEKLLKEVWDKNPTCPLCKQEVKK